MENNLNNQDKSMETSNIIFDEYDEINSTKKYQLTHSEIDKNVNGFKVELKVLNTSNNQIPEYATHGASGFDLRAYLPEPMVIPANKFKIVPTGLFLEIPKHFEVQIRPRSGLAAKHGVTVLNSPGTIDSDYTGEIKIILINHGEEAFIINNGDRIAQGVLATVFAKKLVNISEITSLTKETERNSGGFGSTGVK